MTHETLPASFEWRGTRWNRGVDNSYFPAKDEPHVGLRLRTDCAVWFEEEEGRWRASLVPSPDCVARRITGGTPGSTPQEALDGEVVCSLMTALKLPGAGALLAEVGVLAAFIR